MANFNITGFETSGQTLSQGESGYVGLNGELVTTGVDAVVHTLGVANLTVHGVISALGTNNQAQAISANGSNFTLFIGPTGVLTSAAAAAIFTTEQFVTRIYNQGHIAGRTDGIIADSFSNTADFVLVNSGDIIGGSNGVRVTFGIDSANITNTGTISGATLGLNLSTMNDATDVIVVRNSGTISGGTQAYVGGLTGDTLVNAGVIIGDVFLAGGDDLFEGNGGIVNGRVSGEVGNDTLRGSDGGDDLDGGNDSDVLVGRGGDDSILGGTGADTILGGSGDDSLNGEVNGDIINGNSGDDTIFGEGGDDQLRGGRDDDIISGGNGDDTIRGDSGDDRITGGAGRDDMRGGGGRDVFVFESVSDSGTGAARDRIYDFRSGEDTLDISALAGQAFTFLGASPFTSSGSPEVRAISNPSGTFIYIDANGDGTRDSDIYLIGTSGVTDGDFLL